MFVYSPCTSLFKFTVSEKHVVGLLPETVTTPLWFMRLTHTRLVDSIMDVCGVPQKESAKKACLQIFARSSAPAPGVLFQSTQRPHRKRSSSVSGTHATSEIDRSDVKSQLESAVKNQILPKATAKRLEVFLESGCSPLPADIDEALNTILSAIGKVKLLDAKNQASDPRRLRRYEDIARIVKSFKNLVLLMRTIGIGPLLGTKKETTNRFGSRPLYVALDLGLRQKRKHYNGNLFFQAIVLPDNFFDTDATDQNMNRKSMVGLGTKVAEGGRYDDLVSELSHSSSKLFYFATSHLRVSLGSKISSSRKFCDGNDKSLYDCADSNGESFTPLFTILLFYVLPRDFYHWCSVWEFAFSSASL